MTKQNQSRPLTGDQSIDLIFGGVSYIAVGSMFFILAMTLSLGCILQALLVVLGSLLLLYAPISTILSLCQSITPIVTKIHTIVKTFLLMASIFSVAIALVSIPKLLGADSCLSFPYQLYVYFFLILFLLAMALHCLRFSSKKG